VKKLSLIAIALLLGALATFFVARALGLIGATTPSTDVRLVVAASAIYPGQAIEPAQLKLVSWPQSSVPDQSFTKITILSGRIPKQTIYPGELLLEPKLAAVDAKGGLASTIEFGKRAISVRVNDVVGVAGFALPGSFVDVLVSAKDSADVSFSTTVLTRVKVLAVAQETQADQMKPKVVNAVTLELTPPEAEKLDLARSIGALSLILRNENDTATASSDGTRLSDILKSPPQVPARVNSAPATPRPSSAPRPARPASDETNTVTSIRGIAKREEQP
jgi:pilus assembly protein CpaB